MNAWKNHVKLFSSFWVRAVTDQQTGIEENFNACYVNDNKSQSKFIFALRTALITQITHHTCTFPIGCSLHHQLTTFGCFHHLLTLFDCFHNSSVICSHYLTVFMIPSLTAHNIWLWSWSLYHLLIIFDCFHDPSIICSQYLTVFIIFLSSAHNIWLCSWDLSWPSDV